MLKGNKNILGILVWKKCKIIENQDVYIIDNSSSYVNSDLIREYINYSTKYLIPKNDIIIKNLGLDKKKNLLLIDNLDKNKFSRYELAIKCDIKSILFLYIDENIIIEIVSDDILD
tara:strand:+ start:271 stop:618 length:348 start_codon:yes stop_codon:yes gene_type:complete